MCGMTLPFASTKTYGPISVDLREKFFSLQPSLLSLSFSLTFLLTASLCKKKMAFFFFFTFLISFFFFYFYFLLLFFIFIFLSFFIFLVLSFPLFPPLDTWLNVSHSHKCTTYHAMLTPTPDASKNMKFRQSRNPMKFD